MEIGTLLRFLSVAERLKCSTRHADTSSGRRESVAEHCWRLTLMAWLVRDEFPSVNMERVMELCLIHDLGEAVIGDIPSFEKTDRDEDAEAEAWKTLSAMLPDPVGGRLQALFDELDAQETAEAQLMLALDKMEAVLQHNESDIRSWLPLEYDLQLTYGERETSRFPYTAALKAALNAQTRAKIAEAEKQNGNEAVQ